MDPNELLKEIRALATEVLDAGNPFDACEAGQALAEKVQGMDKWITSGHRLPEVWDWKPRFRGGW